MHDVFFCLRCLSWPFVVEGMRLGISLRLYVASGGYASFFIFVYTFVWHVRGYAPFIRGAVGPSFNSL